MRTMPDGKPIGTLRLAARSDSPTSLEHDGLLQGVARPTSASRPRSSTYSSSQLDRRDPQGQLRRLPVGLVRRARPRLDAQLLDLRPARRLVGLVVLQQGSTTRSTSSSTARWTTPSASAIVKQMQEMLYERLALPGDGVHHDRRGRAQRPVRLLRAAARPGRHLARCSTASYNYIHLRPAAEAGNCDGVTPAPAAPSPARRRAATASAAAAPAS